VFEPVSIISYASEMLMPFQCSLLYQSSRLSAEL